MVKIVIGENDGNQRLDRFLRKYLSDKVPLSYIYKFIRKDVKLNGRHVPEDSMIMPGDEIWFNITEEELSEILRKDEKYILTMRNAALSGEHLPYLNVVFEDTNIVIVNKPKGVLTHGDQNEKKNHLTNQVIDYLIKKGDYNPRTEKTFSPAPVNRLDRNTSGLVAFGKNATALQELNEMIRDRDSISKIYLTLVAGKMEIPLTLKSRMVKDENENLISVIDKELPDGKYMETHVFPIHSGQFKGKWYTLVQVEIVTGRTHQIRAHLSDSGFPVIGDPKYGDPKINEIFAGDFKVSTQLLHAYKLAFNKIKEDGKLHYLQGKSVECDIPEEFKKVNEIVLGPDYMKPNVSFQQPKISQKAPKPYSGSTFHQDMPPKKSGTLDISKEIKSQLLPHASLKVTVKPSRASAIPPKTTGALDISKKIKSQPMPHASLNEVLKPSVSTAIPPKTATQNAPKEAKPQPNPAIPVKNT